MYLESVIWILVILPRSSSHRYRRCSPTVFQGEEEGHLEKRIKARVIQSSSSDWASALVVPWTTARSSPGQFETGV